MSSTWRSESRRRNSPREICQSRADGDSNWRRPSIEFLASATNDMFIDSDTLYVPPYETLTEDETILNDFQISRRYVGDYSEDSEGNLTEEKVGFYFLKEEFRPDDLTKVKEVNFDLNAMIEKSKESLSRKKYQNFVTWVQSHQDVLSNLGTDSTLQGKNVKFVSQANIITRLLEIPYITEKEHRFYATFVLGSIHMKDLKREEHREENPIVSHWAHKYEQYMCDDIMKGTVPDEQFKTVITAKLGPHEVLYYKSIDAVNPSLFTGERDLSVFVNLSYTTVKDEARNEFFKKMKTYLWAVPMVLGGVKELIAGFSKRKGTVSELRLYTIHDLQFKGKNYWNLNKNFPFAVKCLDFVKKKAISNPGEVFLFEKSSGANIITCKKVDAEVLPDWFRELVEKSGCWK